MAADKKPMIVIKKITVNGGGHHGGSWKVAFADFMTAMMAFFLVMWLLNTSEETKKQIARYFSGPSVIEQNFSIYGAELTFEKLFLDLVNEPLKAFQQFVQPADLSPDIMSLGSKKAILFHIAQSLGASARNVSIAHDEVSFELDDYLLFERGKTDPSNRFVEIMEKVKALTSGLEHGKVEVSSLLNVNSVEGRKEDMASRVSTERLDIIKTQVAEAFESDTNLLSGQALIDLKPLRPNAPGGSIKITIKQKEVLPDGSKPRPIQGEIGEKNNDSTVYNDFVRRMTEGQQKRRR